MNGRSVIRFAFACLLSAQVLLSGCTRESEHEGEEAREAEQDVRLRQRAAASLDSYRAVSCTAAIAHIEDLLRPHLARWHERSGGAVPSDLTAVLVQAELWGSQSVALCAQDPARPRFDALRALMASIWRFPKEVTRAELDRQLELLRDQPDAARTGAG